MGCVAAGSGVFLCPTHTPLPRGVVAVGMRIAPHPPHVSGLEELPHPALALGSDACEGYPPPAFSRTSSSLFGAPSPALCPVRALLVPVSFGQTPSLHPL